MTKLYETYLELDNDQFVLGMPITKVDVQQRIVEGFATLDNIDKAGDILDFDASKQAFKNWAGNIREMHQKKAVGRKVSYKEGQYEDPETGEVYNGIYVSAKISKGAEDTWQKVLDGTLAGWSVGGAIQEKIPEVRKSADAESKFRITKYSLGELSLVDNPCNGLASVQLIKSADGLLEETDVLDDLEDLEKAAGKGMANNSRPGMQGTKPMQGGPQQMQQPMQPMEDTDMEAIQAVLDALNAWRLDEVKEGDDHDIAFISSMVQQIKERVWAGDPGSLGNDEAVFGPKPKKAKTTTVTPTKTTTNTSAKKPAPSSDATKPSKGSATIGKNMTKEEIDEVLDKDAENHDEIAKFLQDKDLYDISGVELSAKEKGIFRKFIDFMVGKPAEENESEESEMDEKVLKETIDAALETLAKSSEDKFAQIVQSLVKVGEALDTVATKETVGEATKSLEDALAAVTERVVKLENSGAVQKSAEEDGSKEKLEKKEPGFWSMSIVPEAVQARVKDGL